MKVRRDKVHKNSRWRYLRYKNLATELAKYGVDYEWKKALYHYGLVVVLSLMFGRLYRLNVGYMVLILGIGLLLLPSVMIGIVKRRYYSQIFSLANNYMEQFLYSFKNNRTVLTTLTEAGIVFNEGGFHEVLIKAIEHIRYEVKGEDPEREGLEMVNDFFSCEKVTLIHSFVLNAQRQGGDISRSIFLLSKNRAMWAERICNQQKEYINIKRNIIIALIATLVLCALPLYLLGGSFDISKEIIAQVTGSGLIVFCMGVFIRAEKRLCKNWLHSKNQAKNMKRKYLQVQNYDETREKRGSNIAASTMLLITGIVYGLSHSTSLLILFIAITMFCMNQHKIGYNLAKRKVAKEIEKQFPGWLMDLALLLQTDNVQVALRKSLDTAPEVLGVPLQELVDELEKEPDSIEPYYHFLKVYQNPDVQSVMKMLYSLSYGSTNEIERQIEELIDRNTTTMDKAEKLMQEDQAIGMKLYVLLPSLVAAFKLMTDMALLLMLFLEDVSVGMGVL